MKFRICATSVYWREDLLEHYPILSEYQIEQEVLTDKGGNRYIKNFINIESLDELIQLSKDVGTNLIIEDGNIEIYDGYRE